MDADRAALDGVRAALDGDRGALDGDTGSASVRPGPSPSAQQTALGAGRASTASYSVGSTGDHLARRTPPPRSAV
ncbi:hypothetical protein [Streptomyces sp. NPDC127066]|uniref:hypothetical protein n=1 Tax=Streptomyces sp. NPDC127066 TaxID=3347125 RepID=UPI00365DFB94